MSTATWQQSMNGSAAAKGREGLLTLMVGSLLVWDDPVRMVRLDATTMNEADFVSLMRP